MSGPIRPLAELLAHPSPFVAVLERRVESRAVAEDVQRRRIAGLTGSVRSGWLVRQQRWR
jgi:hypothetical protein